MQGARAGLRTAETQKREKEGREEGSKEKRRENEKVHQTRGGGVCYFVVYVCV
jgi:hypothetical protein